MIKTVAFPENIYKELISLKLQEGNRTAADLVNNLIQEHKKRRFLEASEIFRKELKKKGIKFSDLLKKSKKVREEIADEWF